MRKSNLVVANEILSRRAKRSKIEFFLYGTLLTATHPTFASELPLLAHSLTHNSTLSHHLIISRSRHAPVNR